MIKQGDCLELMKEIPDGSVDAIICDPPYLKKFIPMHEAGHFIDEKLAANGKRYSESAEWLGASLADMKKSGKKSVSKYGENSLVEDFTDSVSYYVDDPKKFKKEFPNRAKLLKKIFGRKT